MPADENIVADTVPAAKKCFDFDVGDDDGAAHKDSSQGSEVWLVSQAPLFFSFFYFSHLGNQTFAF